MANHRKLTLLIASLGVAAALRPAVADPPQHAMTGLFFDQLADAYHAARATDYAVEMAQVAIAEASTESSDYCALPRDSAALDAAAERLHRGHPDDGAAIARRVLEVPQAADVAMRAHDMLGYYEMLHGAPSSSLAHLLSARDLATSATTENGADEPATDQLDGHRSLFIARSALRAAQPELATEAALRVIDNHPNWSIVHEARFLDARARLHIDGQVETAIQDLVALLERYPEYPHWDREQLELADAEARIGRAADAYARLDAYVWARPFWLYAGPAEERMQSLANTNNIEPTHRTLEEQLARGRQVRLDRHWGVADQLLSATLSEAVASEASRTTQNDVRFQLALNAYDSAHFEDCLAWLDEMEEAGRGGASSYQRAKWRARALSRLNRTDEAYQVLVDYHGSEMSNGDHREMAEFAHDVGLFEEALEHMSHYTEGREWQTFDGAFAHYLAGDFDEAEDLFDALADRASGSIWARYTYWRARSYQAEGRVDDAIRLFTEVADYRMYEYYAIQAQNRLTELTEGISRPARIHWRGQNDTAIADISAVLESEHISDLTVYSDELNSDQGIDSLAGQYGHLFAEAGPAAALYRIGAREEARQVLRGAAIEMRALNSLFEAGRDPSYDRPIRLDNERWEHEIDNRGAESRGWWGLADDALRFPIPSDSSERRALVERHQGIQASLDDILPHFDAALRDLGDTYILRRCMFDRDTTSSYDQMDAERAGWLQAYPRPHADTVTEWAVEYGMNPYVLWSLIIVESDMNPDSISHADAYGLLQVIPKTGDLIALRLGEADFGIHSLIDPRESVRYGMYYFNELLTKFHNQELLAMVAYNAGPHQVARWLQWRGDQMDLDAFIETVPYDGARRYPQRILRYLAVYRAIYMGEDQLYVGNELDATFEDNIYF